MNLTSFYSNKKNHVPARSFLNPELSEDSDLSSESAESIYTSESKSDNENNFESTESHSQSGFSESNDEPLVTHKPTSSTQNGDIKKNETASIAMENSKAW